MYKELILAALKVLSSLCLAAQVPITAPPAGLELDPFYKKYLDCDGITVISSERVEDRAFYRLQELLDNMLENRPDLRQTLVDAGFRYIIIAHDEQVTDIPQYSHMRPKEFWNLRARGFGGRTTSCGEENLLNFPVDRYSDESIFIHELAHGIHSPGLRKCDPAFQDRLEALYEQAMDKGLYRNDYASTNPAEYWAEGVQAFFDCDRQNNWNHNHINTREELMDYDPDMAAFIRDIFRITDENDWRYKPLAKQPLVQPTEALHNPEGKFPKYIWCWAFLTFGAENTPDAAMLHAANIVRNMFCYRYDVLKTMIDTNVTLAVYGKDDAVSNKEKLKVDAFIRQQDGQAAAELPENLQLEIAACNLNTLVHDMALAAYFYTGLRPEDPDYDNRQNVQQFEKDLDRIDVRFDQKVQALYDRAMEKGLWKSTPAADNRFEYFAQGVSIFYEANAVSVSADQKIGNRTQLAQYDPELAALIADFFKHTERTDWRYAVVGP